ncbi:MAG: hypothetical protein E7L25_02635 [Varibaculum cambriense]|nr:hypothetical protein [Varibaculum cambriense]
MKNNEGNNTMNTETEKLDHDTAAAREREITGATEWLIKTLQANGGECSFDDLMEAAYAHGYNVEQIRNAAKQKTTYPRIMQRWAEADPLKKYWCLENTEEEATPEKLDYDAYAAEARARLKKVIAGLEQAYEEKPTAQLASAILKAQERLDHYAGFKEARSLLPDTPLNRRIAELENM